MNHIGVKSIKTRYDHPSNYFIIDGKPITSYVEEAVKNNNSSLMCFGSLLGLLPAWGGEPEWQSGSRK